MKHSISFILAVASVLIIIGAADSRVIEEAAYKVAIMRHTYSPKLSW